VRGTARNGPGEHRRPANLLGKVCKVCNATPRNSSKLLHVRNIIEQQLRTVVKTQLSISVEMESG
jgi:hypothetical protein